MNKIELLIRTLEELRASYHSDCLKATRQILGSEGLDPCEGSCGRILYPKFQWQAIPKPFRTIMSKWIIDVFSFDRCAACYRSAVRAGELQPIPRKTGILSAKELEELRRIAGLI